MTDPVHEYELLAHHMEEATRVATPAACWGPDFTMRDAVNFPWRNRSMPDTSQPYFLDQICTARPE